MMLTQQYIPMTYSRGSLKCCQVNAIRGQEDSTLSLKVHVGTNDLSKPLGIFQDSSLFGLELSPLLLNMMFIPLFSQHPNSQVKPSGNLLSVILSFYCPTFPANKLAYYKARRICWEDEPSSRFRCV